MVQEMKTKRKQTKTILCNEPCQRGTSGWQMCKQYHSQQHPSSKSSKVETFHENIEMQTGRCCNSFEITYSIGMRYYFCSRHGRIHSIMITLSNCQFNSECFMLFYTNLWGVCRTCVIIYTHFCVLLVHNEHVNYTLSNFCRLVINKLVDICLG